MLRPISNIFIDVNSNRICVGKVVAECDNYSFCNSVYLTNSEVWQLQKDFKIGEQEIDDLVYHCVGTFVDNVCSTPIEKKWIDELVNMGYNVKTNLTYVVN